MRIGAVLGPLGRISDDAKVVQQRPTLGSVGPGTSRTARWVLPVSNFVAATLALLLAAAATDTSLSASVFLAPLAPVIAFAVLRIYTQPIDLNPGSYSRSVYWTVRLLVGILFVWSASELGAFQGAEEIVLLATYLVLDAIGGRATAHTLRRLRRPERWLIVGDPSTADLLSRYEPLRDYATIVGTVEVSSNGDGGDPREQALEAVEVFGAERVLIASRNADDEKLLNQIRAFKSAGVPVSLLPRPLDLLEAPAATPVAVGGVPQIEVRALASRTASPYEGPDRRHDRHVRVSVVVPTKNEARNLEHVLGQLPEDIHEVILVDAHSEDDTVEVARRVRPDIRVLTQNGRGKGDALRTGFAAVTGNVVVMLDADGSADPAEIPRFVEALLDGADFAKGSRFLEGGGSDDITLLRRAGNAVLSGTANLLHGTAFTDLCYGYNAFWARCLPFVSLDVPGFEVETLINLRVADAGLKVVEVPSYEKDRIHGQSNLNTFRDGFRVLGTILREARRRRSVHTEHPVASAAAIERAHDAAQVAKP